MILEIEIYILLIIETFRTYIAYRALSDQSRAVIQQEVKTAKEMVTGKEDTKVYTWTPPVPEEVSVIGNLLRKVFNK